MRNSKKHFGKVTVVLHWVVALGVFVLFVLGFWMVDLDFYNRWYKAAPALHKSVGLSLFAVMIFRLVWRLSQTQPKSLATHQPYEQKIGKLVHRFLYVLVFITMLAGYFISTADGRGIEVFGLFEVPGLGPLIDNQEDKAGLIHQYVAYFLMLTVLLHALAALKHHFIDKDKTLSRMLGRKS